MMLLTIIGIVLGGSAYGTGLYYWSQNFKKRIDGFYLGLYHGLDAAAVLQEDVKSSPAFLTLFWLTSIPLLGIPLLCLEAGLVLERRRAARQITFCVHQRLGLSRNPDTRKVFVTLPAPGQFQFSEEESHMLFPQTKPGWESSEPGSSTSDQTLSRVPRHAPSPITPTGASGHNLGHQGHHVRTATPGLPYCARGDAQDLALQVLAIKHRIPYPPVTSSDFQSLAHVWNASGRPVA